MVWVTPGIDFLVPLLVVPAGLFYVAISVIAHLLKLSVSQWALILLAVLAVPASSIASIAYQQRKHRKQAEALGARMPPVVDSKSFGNRKLIMRLEKAFTQGYPGDELWELSEEFGHTFNLRLMFRDTVYTLAPDHVKRVLATEFDNWEKGDRFREPLHGFLGTGIFNSDGEMWKFHRTMSRPFFSRNRVTDLERIDKHIQRAIVLLKQRMKTGYAIDFQDLIQRFTMDSATEFLFGTTANSLDILSEDLPQPYNHPDYLTSIEAFSNNPANAFSQAYLRAQTIAENRDRMGWIWPLGEIFGDKLTEDMKGVDAFLMPIVNNAIKINAERMKLNDGKLNEEIGDDESFLDHLASNTSDISVLKDQALNLLLAGRDTTASALTSLFYLLSRHPDVLHRLRKEILDKVGPTNRPTYEDVKDMRYLRAVINETLRLFPPVPWDVRQSINGTVWPSEDPSEKPIYIPPGCVVVYGLIMIQTYEELWGPDAAEFDPDRFLDHRKKRIIDNPFMFVPFNAGPRICLGQQLAYNQISLTVTRLLQNFSSFSLDEEAWEPKHRVPDEWRNGRGRKAKERFKPHVALTMGSCGGMWLKARAFAEDEGEPLTAP